MEIIFVFLDKILKTYHHTLNRVAGQFVSVVLTTPTEGAKRAVCNAKC